MVEIKQKGAPKTDESIVREWYIAQQNLKALQVREKELRELVVEMYFAKAGEGTTHATLLDGADLKCVKKLNYSLDKIKIQIAQDQLIPIIGAELSARLVSWKPDLSIREYKLLPDVARPFVDEALTIKPSTPTLEITVKA